jgi:putative ABC transport system permease protein
MRTLLEWMHRLRSTLRAPRPDHDLEEELRLHVELATEEAQRRGSDDADAERAARLSSGGTAQAMEALRDQRGLPWLDEFWRDLRHAFRCLRRTPAFSSVALVTLAVGMAATIAMFSVLDQVVLRPLPYPEVDRLVRIESPVPGVAPNAVWDLSTAEYFFFGEQARTLESLGIYFSSSATVGADSGRVDLPAERVLTSFVSPEVLELLGARPVLGRLFVAEDHRYDTREGAPGAVISHTVWQSRFGGALDVVGHRIMVDERPVPILGVLAPGVDLPEGPFLAGQRTGIWMPLPLDPNAPATNQHTFRAIARLRPDVSLTAAQRELDTLTSRLPHVFPSAYSTAFMSRSGFSTAVVPLRDDVLGAIGALLWILAGAISLVFIIATANVTNLFLLRAEHRRHETATRLALGASRAHVARYTFLESLLLSLAAAIVALALTHLALRVLVMTAPEDVPRLPDVRVDEGSLLVALIVALLASGCFTFFTTARLAVGGARPLQQGVTVYKPGQRRTRRALVVGQVALSLLLAFSAALTGKSLVRLLSVDPGFVADDVLVADVVLPRARYTTEQQIADYHRRLAEALKADPEIANVGAATLTPLDGIDGCSAVFVEDRSRFAANQNLCLDVTRATPGYFDVLDVRVQGRAPEWSDLPAGAAVVSESAARRLWPGEDPIGKGLRVLGSNPPYYRVVGVAVDVLRHGFDRPPAETVYFPIQSMEGAPVFAPPTRARLVMRAQTQDSRALVSRIRSIAASVDVDVPLANIQPMSTLVAQSAARRSAAAALLTLAAFLAIVLSAVGLYGVISYGVTSRARELAVRLSVGAQPAGIRLLVLRDTMALVLPGLVLGAAAALVSTRLIEELLFGIAPHDAATLVSVGAALFLTGIAAGAVPAWRASRLDPNLVLRVQ